MTDAIEIMMAQYKEIFVIGFGKVITPAFCDVCDVK